MTHMEFNLLVAECSEEVLGILSSIQSMILLTKYYPNHPATKSQLEIISTCVNKLETRVKSAKDRAKNLSTTL